MKKYYEILRELRVDNDLKQDTVAEYLQITKQQYSLYETGKREFKIHHIIKLCTFYNVSADYIFSLPYDYKHPER